jgi:Zn-dependent protease
MEQWLPHTPPTPVADPRDPPVANPFDAAPAGDAFGRPKRGFGRRIGGALAAAVALIAKFAAQLKALLLLLPKLKLLTTAGTAVVSVAAYALFWGWPFAAGLVALLFVHEMGHVIALRREGIKATAPMFIPFMGAVISAKSLGDNALAEAAEDRPRQADARLGALVVAVAGALLNSDLLLALASFGFFLNLFNLLPIVPLDGGRAMAAMAPSLWFVGFGILVAMLFIVPNPILLIIVFFAGLELLRRWRERKSRTLESAAYYRVSPRNRLLVGAVYIGLVVALAFGWDATHILASGGHSFTSL